MKIKLCSSLVGAYYLMLMKYILQFIDIFPNLQANVSQCMIYTNAIKPVQIRSLRETTHVHTLNSPTNCKTQIILTPMARKGMSAYKHK